MGDVSRENISLSVTHIRAKLYCGSEEKGKTRIFFFFQRCALDRQIQDNFLAVVTVDVFGAEQRQLSNSVTSNQL